MQIASRGKLLGLMGSGKPFLALPPSGCGGLSGVGREESGLGMLHA
jgi:hypothetical protein